MSKKNYTIIATGGDKDDTGVIFVDAESIEDAFNYFLYVHNDFDEDDNTEVNHLLEDYPIGICETGGVNPHIEWFYSIEK